MAVLSSERTLATKPGVTVLHTTDPEKLSGKGRMRESHREGETEWALWVDREGDWTGVGREQERSGGWMERGLGETTGTGGQGTSLGRVRNLGQLELPGIHEGNPS